jgi:hypothetical protein
MLQQIFHPTKQGTEFHLSLTYSCYLQLDQHEVYNQGMDDMPAHVI